MTFAILTTTGRNKEAQALANGTALEISEMAWGDGTRVPSGGETALENEVGRKGVQASGTVQDQPNTAFFETLLDETEGPFVIREVGLFDTDGDMIAVAHYDPAVNKPLETVSALLRLHILFSDLENLVLQLQVTEAYVPREREIIAGTGLAGGGPLDADRRLDVQFATPSQALAGTRDDLSMSPATVQTKVQSALDDLIAGAPGALDTLNELAVALLDNDSEIAALVTQLGTKLNASAYTAEDVLAKLRNVDGEGSFLNADLLDGFDAIYFTNATHIDRGTLADARLPPRLSAENLPVVPTGAIVPFAGGTPPNLFLECDGAALSRTTYAELFAAIGTIYGAPSGTTFSLPDLRGEFLRGWDNGRGVDAGRVLGSAQADEFREHRHTVRTSYDNGEVNNSNNLFLSGDSGQPTHTAHPNAIELAGGDETRPRNIALMYCIKF